MKLNLTLYITSSHFDVCSIGNRDVLEEENAQKLR